MGCVYGNCLGCLHQLCCQTPDDLFRTKVVGLDTLILLLATRRSMMETGLFVIRCSSRFAYWYCSAVCQYQVPCKLGSNNIIGKPYSNHKVSFRGGLELLFGAETIVVAHCYQCCRYHEARHEARGTWTYPVPSVPSAYQGLYMNNDRYDIYLVTQCHNADKCLLRFESISL